MSDQPTPMREPKLPGRPLGSGFTPLPPAEQEEFQRQHREMIRRLTPFFEDVRACQVRAWAKAQTYVIG